MANLSCDVCINKKLIWGIFECNIENKEECPCINCIVLATCTRLCNKIANVNSPGRCELRRELRRSK